jgi:hypothetical protein
MTDFADADPRTFIATTRSHRVTSVRVPRDCSFCMRPFEITQSEDRQSPQGYALPTDSFPAANSEVWRTAQGRVRQFKQRHSPAAVHASADRGSLSGNWPSLTGRSEPASGLRRSARTCRSPTTGNGQRNFQSIGVRIQWKSTHRALSPASSRRSQPCGSM